MTQTILALGSGGLVGFVLGLIGGGGSVVATPLLLYAVGLSPHVALGTGALAVSANALVNFAGHARAGNVRWNVAGIFSVAGVLGALLGSTLGKAVDGQRLVLLFAAMMVVIGIAMLRPRRGGGQAGPIALTAPMVLRIGGVGLGVGLLSGFFGIGGGFLIVPGLILATGMPMIHAVGTSLLAVGAFGLATALNYAASGLVDWGIAAEFIAGGIAGGALGMRAACRLAADRNTLNRIFAAIVFAVAAYIVWRSVGHA
ncbi:sulfite exporter TauE/SafE family protein [Roseomonas sp. NAR14]|uniref:Probable membrane transporter protein n=1 Tax=Roseomonas acroporae TaxID=2937791 RepID=A0A9X1YBH3_9PROT|nr:sulfite exporter TauE/SafE family protein [Roseomonas acroporae]MCK8787374.1 sulfite exporter TauE/SafE family protein [Roseomonas acroporae]